MLGLAFCIQGGISFQLKSTPWILAEFRHNNAVETPDENDFSIFRQHKEK